MFPDTWSSLPLQAAQMSRVLKSSSFLKQVHGIDKTAMSSSEMSFGWNQVLIFPCYALLPMVKLDGRNFKMKFQPISPLTCLVLKLSSTFWKRTILSARKIPGEVPVIFLQMSISVSGSNLLNPWRSRRSMKVRNGSYPRDFLIKLGLISAEEALKIGS